MERVLIVEDNPVLIKILQTGLKKYSDKFETITARDGQEAIDILKREPVSLLVTDIQMPRIDGLSLLAYMNEHHPEIPCIVMTAHGTKQMKEKLQQDVLRFLEKPFEIEELVEAILPALNRDIPEGSINGISIASFMQMIEMEQKTCLLEVEPPHDGKGYFYFKDGILYDAAYGSSKGVEAALKLIPIENAKIRFKKVVKSGQKIARRIKDDLMNVIMEAMRLKDEADSGEDFDSFDITGKFPEIEEFDFFESEETAQNGTRLPEHFQEGYPSEKTTILKKAEREPLLKTTRDEMGIHLKKHLERLARINGYRGSAIMNFTGEILEKDSKELAVDIAYCSAMFNDVFLSANKVCEKVGFETNQETTVVTPRGIVLMRCSGIKSNIHIHVMVIMEPDGNQALMKMEMERMMPGLLGELA